MNVDIQFNPLDPWHPRPIVGEVYKTGAGFIIHVDGAQKASWMDEEYTTVYKGSKQECWDYIARNYPNNIFHWNV